ncbi:hypothetical protein GDO81_017888 [Engystomops pustulosus]|uniref:Vav guanine nucleotide exchange factor 3 n=1 Tax=Engystomops pustulosus TaxID=76066 RepID=A0AAV7AAD0_ENGPU|nr:hypothetical protein GDO81_017888 [Engystomops pustulosus]
MEPWRQCAQWLIRCRVLPHNHRVTWDTAQVFDLAQTLRDGVLLCQLLKNLQPSCINLKDINLRPQMSQFLCLKNIRTFLSVCCEAFNMKKSDLFEAFDLFDVRDFAKVIETLSKLSHTPIALSCGIRPFPTEESVQDEDIYKALPDLIDESGMEEDDELYYDCVYREDEADEVYEDLMKAEAALPSRTAESDIRSCCLLEIKQTEEKYSETLESIEKFFMDPLKKFLPIVDLHKIFINIPELVKLHKSLVLEVNDSITHKSSQNLYQIFLKFKERLLIYGEYCSQVESAISILDSVSKTREDVRLKLEECSKRANNGKFTLRDLLVVPMQRVLKYHLLLQLYFLCLCFRSNIRPEYATSNNHEFKMHTFERVTSCKVCQMLLRGTFFQGYFCSKCGTGAHKECLGRVDTCGRGDSGTLKPWRENGPSRSVRYTDSGLPRLQVIRTYSGYPAPPVNNGPSLTIQIGDTIELIRADPHSLFWQGKNIATGELGFFPSDAVKPSPCQMPKPVDYSGQLWYAGAMERVQAEVELMNRENSTYLIRHRTKEIREYAISIKYNNEVKHIKILTRDGFFRIAENRKFKTLMELVEYYKHQSLREGFRSLDTTLLFPYKVPENEAGHASNRTSGMFLSPKILGIAIARYDFCARDMRELSLFKGDVVKIYTKSGTNGWWRGESNGKVQKCTAYGGKGFRAL